MSINLKKKEDKIHWYFSKDGSQQGPFELNELLLKITPDTLVWKEGIEWTNAKFVPELSPFFQTVEVEKIIQVNSSSTKNSSSALDSMPVTPKKMFAAPFSFDGRIRRTEYGISLIIYAVAYTILAPIVIDSSIFGLAYIPLFWFVLAQGAKRCHDRNNSGWFQIIPFYGLWMLFAEGDRTINAYGNPPK
jgi:uncharacterized membrane protein YhaH (DUF805 family)